MSKHPRVIEIPPAPGIDPDDDSDSALWKSFNYYKGQKRQQELKEFLDDGRKQIELQLGVPLHAHSEYHYSFVLLHQRVDYWPSGKRWRWCCTTYYGNWKALLRFIINRQPKKKG